MQPQEVLELIQSAPTRYETVRAVLRYRGDGPMIKTVLERFVRSAACTRTFGEPPETADEASDPEPDGPLGWRCKVWRIDNHRWRQETELTGGGVDIWTSTGRMRTRGTPEGPPGTSEEWHWRIGGNKRSEDPPWLIPTADTYWTMYPFDAQGIASLNFELEALELQVKGYVRRAGREAVRLVGAPVEEWEAPPEPLWWGADEYEVVVDTERGILLRCASRLGGKDIDALEVEEVFFDEQLPEDVFTSREPLLWD